MAGSQSVIRALEVLKRFSRGQTQWTLRDLTIETGLPKPTVYRLLQALVSSGFLLQDPSDQSYTTGPELQYFTRGALTQMEVQALLSIAYRPMAMLHEVTRETVCLYRRFGSSRVLLAELESPEQMRIVLGAGRVRRLYEGSVGKVFLLHASDPELAAEVILANEKGVSDDLASVVRQVEEVRRDGYCISRGTSLPGAATVSAPIYSGSAVVEAALLITGPAVRWTEDQYIERARLVADSARLISETWTAKGVAPQRKTERLTTAR